MAQETSRIEVVPMTADDGLPLKLRHVWIRGRSTRGAVLLVHGVGNRAEVFRPPVKVNLVDALLADGWDVWLFDWRASKDVGFVPWTLDHAASYDHPAAVRHVRAFTGGKSLKAIVHCMGSVSFTMAAAAGLLPGVDTVVSNAVSLHPVVSPLSQAKYTVLPLLRPLTRHLSPGWGDDPEGLFGHALRLLVRGTHRECGNDVCRMASFFFGGASPAMWSHEHLDRKTHEWLRGEFGDIPVAFFRQIARAIRAGQIEPSGRLAELPDSFVQHPPRTSARFVFLAGGRNRCFLPESQRRSYAYFNRHQPGRHRLHVFPGYGHLDVFVGKNAAYHTFPTIIGELRR